MEKIVVAMADDHLLFRQGIMAGLRKYQNIDFIYDVANGKALLEKLDIFIPNLILLDVDMPGMDGQESLKRIIRKFPHAKVLMIGDAFNKPFISEFIRLGARGYLDKSTSFETLAQAIIKVYTVGHYHENISEPIKLKFSNKVEIEFTKKENEILSLIRSNKTDFEIFSRLQITGRTLEWHRSNLMRKTATINSKSLYAWALENIF